MPLLLLLLLLLSLVSIRSWLRCPAQILITKATSHMIPLAPQGHGLTAQKRSDLANKFHFTGYHQGPVGRCCRASGEGLSRALVERVATFAIEAHDSNGSRLTTGGATFAVNIRATGNRYRSKLFDHGDGKYTVRFKPTAVGKCTITISLMGESLPGSPFTCVVSAPRPHAPNCIVRLPNEPTHTRERGRN